jgi:hypothetical protein
LATTTALEELDLISITISDDGAVALADVLAWL